MFLIIFFYQTETGKLVLSISEIHAQISDPKTVEGKFQYNFQSVADIDWKSSFNPNGFSTDGETWFKSTFANVGQQTYIQVLEMAAEKNTTPIKPAKEIDFEYKYGKVILHSFRSDAWSDCFSNPKEKDSELVTHICIFQNDIDILYFLPLF